MILFCEKEHYAVEENKNQRVKKKEIRGKKRKIASSTLLKHTAERIADTVKHPLKQPLSHHQSVVRTALHTFIMTQNRLH